MAYGSYGISNLLRNIPRTLLVGGGLVGGYELLKSIAGGGNSQAYGSGFDPSAAGGMGGGGLIGSLASPMVALGGLGALRNGPGGLLPGGLGANIPMMPNLGSRGGIIGTNMAALAGKMPFSSYNSSFSMFGMGGGSGSVANNITASSKLGQGASMYDQILNQSGLPPGSQEYNQLKTQLMLQKLAQTMQFMSNVMQLLHETAMAVVRNVRA